MTVNPTKPAPLKEKTFMQRLISDFQKHKYKYLLILPIIIYLLLFCYKPMYGLIIAFKNYRPTRGIWDSKWVGFMWFETFFKDPYFWRLLRNTFSISGLTILFGFPAPILLPTITILFILRMGNILNVGYEKILLLYNPSTYEVADVLSTYTYRMGLENQQYSLSTAVGLFTTMVNVVFLLITNYISNKTTESGLF